MRSAWPRPSRRPFPLAAGRESAQHPRATLGVMDVAASRAEVTRPRIGAALIAAGLLVLSLALPGPAAGHGAPSLGTYVTTSAADLKKGPGAQYETIRVLPKGKVFEIVGKQGAWLVVRLSEHDTRSGYVEARLATTIDLRHLPQGRLPIPGVYVTTSAVDVRGGPSREHAVLATLPAGARIVVIGMEANWLKIESRRGESARYIERSQVRLQPSD